MTDEFEKQLEMMCVSSPYEIYQANQEKGWMAAAKNALWLYRTMVLKVEVCTFCDKTYPIKKLWASGGGCMTCPECKKDPEKRGILCATGKKSRRK